MESQVDNILTLTDQDGSEVDFQLLDLVPYEGRDYAVLLPVDDESETPEAVILELLPGTEEEGDQLQGVDDEALLNAVFTLYLQRQG